MESSIRRFRRLLISAEVIDNAYAVRIHREFTAAGMAVAVEAEAGVDEHPWAAHGPTLVVKARPAGGWLAAAEHGSLAVRPHEFYLHPVIGCASACTYCYLQAHPLGRRPLRLHVRIDELIAAIERQAARLLAQAAVPLFCTGELADSLADASVFPVGAALARRFARGDIGTLELRTKSDLVEPLLDVVHRGRTTVGFSVAPQVYVARYEPMTAALDRRLAAAAAVARAGYPVALKCEPLVLEPGWEAAYADMFRRAADALPPAGIDHVSVGCLRWGGRLADHPTFGRRHGAEVAAGTLIEYRPGRHNGTLPRDRRLAAYRRVRTLLRQAGLTAPIWWSLEEADVIGELANSSASRR
jgi:DNA repair photolyase